MTRPVEAGTRARNKGVARPLRSLHRQRRARGVARFLCRRRAISGDNAPEPQQPLAYRHHVLRRARDDARQGHSAQKSDLFEPHVYRHIVSSVLIDRAADGSYEVESGFQILRTGAEGSTVIYSCGRYLDEVIAQGGQMLFRKRTVILDSPRIDTLLVITL